MFSDYYALYQYDDAAYVPLPNGTLSKPGTQYIQWWIVKKDFYDRYGYIDDCHLGIDIPDFGEDMESCFSYQKDWPNSDLELQSSLLRDMGFEVEMY